MFCEEHCEQNVIAFCEDCVILVCCDCITDKHERHKFQKLAKVAEKKRQKILNEILCEKESILSDLRERYEELEVSKKEGSKLEENIIKDIQDRAEKMKTHIECIKNEHVSKVRGLFQSQIEALNRKTTSINEATEKLIKLSDEKESLQNESDIEIIQMYICIYKQLEEVRNKSKISLIEGKFLSGGDFETNLEKIFGSFENENETSSDDLDLPDPVDIRKLEYVDMGLTGTLQSLHLTEHDKGWILCSSTLYFANSISMKKYTEKAKDVISFAVSKEGEVYFVTSSSIVKKINTDDTVTRWCEMAPYQPKYILLQKLDEIRVVLWSQDDKKYFIFKFDRIGRKLKIEKFESFMGNLDKLKENEFGEMCIIHYYYYLQSKIFTVDVNLSKSFFNGVLGATPSENYYISDFCYVSQGRIAVLDDKNNVVYLLDRKCSFIKLLTSIDEINSPKYVSLDQFGRLWISSSSGTYILSNWDQ